MTMILGPRTAYTGIGDLVSGATFFGGLQAYSGAVAAKGTQKSVNLRRLSDNATQDIVILNTGTVDVASALTFAGTDATGAGTITGTAMTFTGGHQYDTVSGAGVTPGTFVQSGASPNWVINPSQTVAAGTTLTLTWGLRVATIYDQAGTVDLVQATAARQPLFLPTGGGPASGQPNMLFSRGDITYLQGTISAIAQPNSFSMVARRNGTFTSFADPVSTYTSGGEVIQFTNAANTWDIFAGSSKNATANDSVWHDAQAVFSGAASVLSIDNTQSTLSPGTAATGTILAVGSDPNNALSQAIDGSIVEVAMYQNKTFSAANMTAISANQHSRWGF